MCIVNNANSWDFFNKIYAYVIYTKINKILRKLYSVLDMQNLLYNIP